MEAELSIVTVGTHTRLGDILEYALDGIPFAAVTPDRLADADLTNRRVLFALTCDAFGMSAEALGVIRHFRMHTDALAGATGAVLIDGASELYTKQLARSLVLSANMAGCRFPGKPLVEATKSLQNFDVLCGVHGVDRYTAYKNAAKQLIMRLLADQPARRERPNVLLLHASNPERSNTYAVGKATAQRLADRCEVTELSMHSAAIYECNGCSYHTCTHFAEQETCFYGGILPETVFPAIERCDALLLLCPNYNDAPGAHFISLNNRLNALLRRSGPLDKALFAVVVSGYSGGDIVAEQLAGGLCLNKSFSLPPRFCLLETANDPGAAMQSPGVGARIDAFADGMQSALCVSGRRGR